MWENDDKTVLVAGVVAVVWLLLVVLGVGLAGYGVFYLIDRALDIWAAK